MCPFGRGTRYDRAAPGTAAELPYLPCAFRRTCALPYTASPYDPAPLIGRRTTRAWLTEAVTDAIAGRGALVLVSGRAGVGKTQLVKEIATAADATFLRGAAMP